MNRQQPSMLLPIESTVTSSWTNRSFKTSSSLIIILIIISFERFSLFFPFSIFFFRVLVLSSVWLYGFIAGCLFHLNWYEDRFSNAYVVDIACLCVQFLIIIIFLKCPVHNPQVDILFDRLKIAYEISKPNLWPIDEEI